RAVEAAGDIDVLLLDKTGTITLGNRQATAFVPADGGDPATLADAAQLGSLADETPEGRSIVVLAKERYGIRERDIHALKATFVPFTAQTRSRPTCGRPAERSPPTYAPPWNRSRSKAPPRWSSPRAPACSA